MIQMGNFATMSRSVSQCSSMAFLVFAADDVEPLDNPTKKNNYKRA
jgi:hypothetical protein